jgi:acyl-CoA synthetase (AMP-forming)/AMP-acid ligase II
VPSPRDIAREDPDRVAVVMAGSGDQLTYGELEDRADRLAQLFRARGLEAGSHVALVTENQPRALEVLWAAQRAGLYYTAVSTHLGTEEMAYIVEDAGAQAIISTAAQLEKTENLLEDANLRLLLGGAAENWDDYDEALAEMPDGPIADECEGEIMLYSSGTTGKPKGVKRKATFGEFGTNPDHVGMLIQGIGAEPGGAALLPGPIYHVGPLTWSMAAHRIGMTVVMMERFDAEQALRAINEHDVTVGLWVPTMFVRMLKLDEDVRDSFDVSSLKAAVHTAAPCPVDIKRRMIEWWGPVLFEFYASTEAVGVTFITSEQWLEHPGSVGKAVIGEVHILDDDGNEVEAGTDGTVFFSGGLEFEYHNDADKTASARNDRGMVTVGDVGHVDEDGFLYLTDRKAYTIISGGVNIYPQEAEDVLVGHDKVRDAAVIGVPHEEWGEEVKAVVELVDPGDAGEDTADELIAFCKSKIASYKCPRSVDFEDTLPREENGKLYKRQLVDRYRAAAK